MPRLILASKDDAKEIFNIVQKTVREIYPKYYLSISKKDMVHLL